MAEVWNEYNLKPYMNIVLQVPNQRNKKNDFKYLGGKEEHSQVFYTGLLYFIWINKKTVQGSL